MTSAAILRRETALSSVINAALSAAFFVAVFGLSGVIPVRGAGNLALDFLPQSAAVALMSTLMPALMVRRAILAGKVGAPEWAPTSRRIVLHAVRNALIALVVGAVAAGLLWLAGPDVAARAPAFAGKVLYGAFLGSITTRFELQSMLR